MACLRKMRGHLKFSFISSLAISPLITLVFSQKLSKHCVLLLRLVIPSILASPGHHSLPSLLCYWLYPGISYKEPSAQDGKPLLC